MMFETEKKTFGLLAYLEISQFSTCSGWRWFEEDEKLKKVTTYWKNSFMEIFTLKPLFVGKFSLFWCKIMF